jgi:superfamily II DNA or RNA helicase
MSCKINISEIDNTTLTKLKSKAVLKIDNNGKPDHVLLTRLIKDKNIAFIPFSMARSHNLPLPSRDKFPVLSSTFDGTLRDSQMVVRREAIDLLEKNHSVIISCFTGFGKTIGAINLACKLRLKTLIVVTRVVLMNQWEESILKFCNSTNKSIPIVEIVSSSSKDDYVMCDFAIINAINIHKMEPGFLESFGTVIVDEVHLVMARKTFQSLLHLTPRYLIALSATSYRSDGLDALFSIFFGKEKIIRELHRDHTIYRVNTLFKPQVKYAINGKMDWNALLEDQASNEERNRLIVNIVKENSSRTFLILVKRIKQGEWLALEIEKELEKMFGKKELSMEDKMEKCDINPQISKVKEKKKGNHSKYVATLFGSNQEFDKSCKVLIGTSAKIGTGFDFDRLDTLLLAADVRDYYIQFIGRIMRRDDVKPVIFDLVDNNKTLFKHYTERLNVYKKHGGTVKVY